MNRLKKLELSLILTGCTPQETSLPLNHGTRPSAVGLAQAHLGHQGSVPPLRGGVRGRAWVPEPVSCSWLDPRGGGAGAGAGGPWGLSGDQWSVPRH